MSDLHHHLFFLTRRAVFAFCGQVVEALARGTPADGGPAKPLADVRTNTIVSRVQYPAEWNVLVHVPSYNCE